MYIPVTLIIFFASHVHVHAQSHSIMLYLAARGIHSITMHWKTKEEYRLAERKVMNISPHLVHLRITEERIMKPRLDSRTQMYCTPNR